MGFFSKAKPNTNDHAEQDPSTILEGHPEVPDCITPYESGLMSALGKTSGQLAKDSEGVLQALMQASRSPYTYGDGGSNGNQTPSSSGFVTLNCNDERQLVKDCLQRITAEAKARRFGGADASSSGGGSSTGLDAPLAAKNALPATPPPSFMFADFAACEVVLKRYTQCTEAVAADYVKHYGQRVELMQQQRAEMMKQAQQQAQHE